MLSNTAIRFLYRINCAFWKIACSSQRPFELSSFPSTIQNSLQPPARPTPESYLNRREAPTLEMARLLICSAQHTPSFARTSATAIAAHRCSHDLGHRSLEGSSRLYAIRAFGPNVLLRSMRESINLLKTIGSDFLQPIFIHDSRK